MARTPRAQPQLYAQVADDLHVLVVILKPMAWSAPTTTRTSIGRDQITQLAWCPLIWWNARTGKIQMQAVPQAPRVLRDAVEQVFASHRIEAPFSQENWTPSKLLSIPHKKMLAWAKQRWPTWIEIPPELGATMAGELKIRMIGKRTYHSDWGEIQFANLEPADFKTHTAETLNRLCVTAVEACQQTWNWAKRDLVLEVYSHPSSRAMGLAYNPGAGTRRISLHRKLLQDYDEAAILRVILHELCHHAREELYPRDTSRRGTRADWSDRMHDDRFCEMLAQVDPLARDNKKECTFFSDEVWSDAPTVQARTRATTFDAKKGYLHLRTIKGGQFRFDWIPDQGRKQVIPMSRLKLLEFVKQFPQAQRREIVVQAAPKLVGSSIWAGGRNEVADLWEVIARMHRGWPRHGFDQVLEEIG